MKTYYPFILSVLECRLEVDEVTIEWAYMLAGDSNHPSLVLPCKKANPVRCVQGKPIRQTNQIFETERKHDLTEKRNKNISFK